MAGSTSVSLSNQEDIRSSLDNRGAVYGGISIGAAANRAANLPDFLASRNSETIQAPMSLERVAVFSALLIVGALIIKKVA